MNVRSISNISPAISSLCCLWRERVGELENCVGNKVFIFKWYEVKNHIGTSGTISKFKQECYYRSIIKRNFSQISPCRISNPNTLRYYIYLNPRCKNITPVPENQTKKLTCKSSELTLHWHLSILIQFKIKLIKIF